MDAVDLLKSLIKTPSFSSQEEGTAALIQDFLSKRGVALQRKDNNIWAYNKYFNPTKPSILLNAHHDTVKPNTGWVSDPFKASQNNDKLTGLGSNDDGGSLVSIMAAFLHFYNKEDLKYNLIFSATAEEESSGDKSIRSILADIGTVEMAIVGEPTGMQMAIAERGLIVLHCKAKGIAGHAARGNGENAIYKAIEDVNWFKSFRFEKHSKLMGDISMMVTGMQGGIQHNVIPDECTYMVDIRTTDAYTHPRIIEIIKENIVSEIERQSNNLNPSSIDENHILVQTAKKLNIPLFVSPTLSDQSQLSVPSIKMGPGLSERSHTAEEFILLSEIEEGIKIYIKFLAQILYN